MPNPIVHFEFWSHEPEKISAFYQDVFGWQIAHMPGLGYWGISTRGGDGPGIDGGMFVPKDGPLPAKLSCYIQVDDIDADLAKVEETGGKTIVPKMEIEGIGWSAIFLDPDERAIGLYTPAAAP